MKKSVAILFTIIVICSLSASINPASAGTGTYNQGTPDKLTLNVVFQFNVEEFNPNQPWQDTFTRASELLYNSSEGQLQIGTINFYNNCPQKNNDADILINSGTGRASAHIGGLGTSGLHVTVYNDTHTQDIPSVRGHFGVVHEFGHYVFALYDEYIGEDGTPTSCISPDSTIASIMDGGTTVQPSNQRTEWALAGDQEACEDTWQYQERDMMDWPWIVQYVADKYNSTLSAPSAYNITMPSGHQALTFNYYECQIRAVVCLDRSGSMGGTKLATAKEGANLFVDLTRDSDELGVSSFSTSATVNYPINLMTDANKTAAHNAINSLVASGLTNIGGGLQTSLNMITGQGTPVSNEVIVLLSDGLHNTGTSPSAVLPSIIERGVVVFTIGLGSGADTTLLSNIANQTGGSYFFAASATGLPAHFNTIFSQLRNDGAITKLEEDIASGELDEHSVIIDIPTQIGGEATFVLSWVSGALDLTLIRPDGTQVYDDDPDVALHISDPLSEIYRLNDPSVGAWRMLVTSSLTNTRYDLQVNSSAASNVSVVTSTDQGVYDTNEQILIRTSVLGPPVGSLEGQSVAGAEVYGVVSIDGIESASIILFDDGDITHGDAKGNDGIYSNYFYPLSGGNYSFNITVNNLTGTTAPPDEEGEGWVPELIAPFTRLSQVTVVVEEAIAQPPNLTVPSTQIVQFSDPLSFTVSATDPDDAVNTLTFSATGLPNDLSLTDNGDGTATVAGIVSAPPGTYNIEITTTDPDGLSATAIVSVVVGLEDARVTYTGPMLVSTPCTDCTTATVPLRASIQDITAVLGDPAYDAYPGDITNATVSFINRESNAVLCSAPVTLLDPSDPTTGTAFCDWFADIGANDGYDFNLGILVDGYYTRNSTADDVIVVISKPSTNSITGGGYLLNLSTAGTYAGDLDLRTHFGFNIKFINNQGRGQDIVGRATVIVRHDGHIYRIRTNALDSLIVVPASNDDPAVGEFYSKASIEDVTDPNNPILITSQALLNFTMTDYEDASGQYRDLLGISVWAKNGALLFSSNWTGTQTIEQAIEAGNLEIHQFTSQPR